MASPVGSKAAAIAAIDRPLAANDQDIASLVKALREGRAHIFENGRALDLHIGSINDYRRGWVGLTMNGINISTSSGRMPDISKNVATLGDISFPLNLARLHQALSYL
jgi:hypothetical protein